MQYDGRNAAALQAWLGDRTTFFMAYTDGVVRFTPRNVDCRIAAEPGDWVVESNGVLFAMRAEVFAETYESA